MKIKELSRNMRFNTLKPIKHIAVSPKKLRREQRSVDNLRHPLTIKNVKKHEKMMSSKGSMNFRSSVDSKMMQDLR